MEQFSEGGGCPPCNGIVNFKQTHGGWWFILSKMIPKSLTRKWSLGPCFVHLQMAAEQGWGGRALEDNPGWCSGMKYPLLIHQERRQSINNPAERDRKRRGLVSSWWIPANASSHHMLIRGLGTYYLCPKVIILVKQSRHWRETQAVYTYLPPWLLTINKANEKKTAINHFFPLLICSPLD